MTKLRYAGTRLNHPDLGEVVNGQVIDVPDDDVESLIDNHSFERADSDAESELRTGETASQSTPAAATDDGEGDERQDGLTQLTGVGSETAESLRDAGYGSLDAIAITAPEKLAGDVSGVSAEVARDFHRQLESR